MANDSLYQLAENEEMEISLKFSKKNQSEKTTTIEDL